MPYITIAAIQFEIIFAGHKYAADSRELYYNPKQNVHNFFFVTRPAMFNKLKKLGFNVVLQNNRSVTDDGSLSVYAAKRGINYINVEARHGALQTQIKMLRALP